jgi:DNA helicase II / ATP-dependent DNA helicase PcrA
MVWTPEPAPDAENPLSGQVRTARWPVDPLGARRSAVAEGANLVLAALAEDLAPTSGEVPVSAGGDSVPAEGNTGADGETDDPDGWIADTDVLLAERAAAGTAGEQVALPGQLSVSQLVELARDPASLADRLRRPLPVPPNTYARRGTEFHGWLERRFGGQRLLEIDDLPGAADAGEAGDDAFAELCEAFEASEWGQRIPHEVEVPFSTEIDGITVRGRMDAVFADADGGWTVVDWKTGSVPDEARLRPLAVQLAAYRLAWAALSGTPLEKVRAAFHYVRHDHTLSPADLLDADGLRTLLHSLPEPA